MIPTRAGDRCFRFSGIIIPWRAGRLTRIKIRRIDDGKPKYAGRRAVAGGAIGTSGMPLTASGRERPPD